MTEIIHAPAWAPLVVKREGLVRASGRLVRDDTGVFHPLTMTLMWAYHGWMHERDRLNENIQFLKPYNFDGVRIGAQLTGAGWDANPLDPGYEQNMAELIDYLYAVAGLRTELFAVGDTGAQPMGLAISIANIVRGREHKILSLEASNESHATIDEMVEMVRFWRTSTQVPLLALTSPGDLAALLQAYDRAGATEFTVHTERGGDAWRMVRQGRDLQQFPGIVNSNEPPGPHSSIASITAPRTLAMLRANCLIGRAPKFCLHVADMVAGQVDPAHGRVANLWEIDNIDQILKVVRGVDRWFPEGCEQWATASVHGDDQGNVTPAGPIPLLPDRIWSDGFDHGVDRAYALVDGGRFVQVLNGVRDRVELTARGAMDITVIDPLTGEGEHTTLADGGKWSLAGDAEPTRAYIVTGNFR